MSMNHASDTLAFRALVWLVALLLVLQPVNILLANAPDDCEEIVKRAARLYDEALLAEAIKLLKPCLDRPDMSEPWRKDAYLLMAKCWLQSDMLQKEKEAEKAVEALLRIDCAYVPPPMELESLSAMVEDVRKRVCGGQITVTVPAAGDLWVAGSTQTVQWAWANLTGDVKIEFSSDGGKTFRELVKKARNTGSAEIVLPTEPADACLVRVISMDNQSVSGLSGHFDVVGPGWWSTNMWYVIGGAVVVGGVAAILLAGKKDDGGGKPSELPYPPQPPTR